MQQISIEKQEISKLTRAIVALVQSKNPAKIYLVEQVILSLDSKSAQEVISNCLHKLSEIDESLHELFISKIPKKYKL